MITFLGIGALPSLLILCADCLSGPPPLEMPVRELAVSGLDDVLSTEGVTFDEDVSTDGNGSLRIEVAEPGIVPLYEVRDLEIESPSGHGYFACYANLKARDLDGVAYLQLECPGEGPDGAGAQATGLRIGGTTDWSALIAPFHLPAGRTPERARVSLVIEGPGTVWIDEIGFSWMEYRR